MLINANTKIANLLKHNANALEAIVSLSPDFKKLRNPVLRKLMAGRTSIAMAAKVGGCKVEDFFRKLQPLGFEINDSVKAETKQQNSLPPFLTSVKPEQIIVLDVRSILETGKDPLPQILEKVNQVQQHQVLKIINTFEPTPLMHLLKKQGFESFAHAIDEHLVETYFYKKDNVKHQEDEEIDHTSGWNEILQRFENALITVDVRDLEMPLPMHTILAELETLPGNKVLYVYHKRIPVFLLPELRERNFDYRIKEISDSEVHLLIFKN
jgi:uncharacterized protein (DUF2249 family)